MIDNYFEFCKWFDKAYRKEITAGTLEVKARELGIDFYDFCDANDFTDSNNWAECLKEYGEQIETR